MMGWLKTLLISHSLCDHLLGLTYNESSTFQNVGLLEHRSSPACRCSSRKHRHNSHFHVSLPPPIAPSQHVEASTALACPSFGNV